MQQILFLYLVSHQSNLYNIEGALKVYNELIKKLNENTDDKKNVIKSEEKLQQLGCVDYVRNIKPEQQEMLSSEI